ncbi:hypothetical protein VTN77DRAFT_9864 [Rasamsonia byssochlamydoides]|uniref:uncharacterized protein n=1 Tax=Rasamsonia byssochlamydoides TaxID=89139 RepID=UPI00374265F4
MAGFLSYLFRGQTRQEIPVRRPISAAYLGLKTLYTPSDQNDSSGDISLDIVAVHGIGADPYFTWVTNQVHWLENAEMLPQRFPDARIMSFGYESQWFGAHAVKISLLSVAEDLLQDLDEARKHCATRPMIFIGHCFGGLVIQQALLNARLRKGSVQSIFDHTVGVVFLGTPFRGTGEITAQGLLHSAVAAGCDVQPAVLGHLRREDNTLNYVVQEFSRLCKEDELDHLNIVCFYEQKESKVGRVVGNDRLREFVVDKASGCIDGYPNYGLGLDHFQLNKFPGPDNIYYRRVARELRLLYEKRGSKLRNRLDRVPISTQEQSLPEVLRKEPPRGELSTIEQECLRSLFFAEMDRIHAIEDDAEANGSRRIRTTGVGSRLTRVFCGSRESLEQGSLL